jgi:predicted acetyltransferase
MRRRREEIRLEPVEYPTTRQLDASVAPGAEASTRINLSSEITQLRLGPSGGTENGEVELQRVSERDKTVLANLLQLYRHDLSAERAIELTEHGTFIYRFLDHYFVDGGDREADFIRDDGTLAGFIMTRLLSEGVREMSEFFVVRAHRRRGVGRRAAELVFRRHPGSWEVAFDDGTQGAATFWQVVVAGAAKLPVRQRKAHPPERSFHQTVLRFST